MVAVSKTFNGLFSPGSAQSAGQARGPQPGQSADQSPSQSQGQPQGQSQPPVQGTAAPAAASSDSGGLTAQSTATSAAMVAPSMLAQLLFTFVLLLFLLASGDMFYEKLVRVLPSFSDKRRAMRIVFSIKRKLSRYLLTIAAINAGVGVSVGLAVSLIGLPDAALIGLVACLFNFVPYIGPLAGIILVAGIAAVKFAWLRWAGVVAGSYLAVAMIEGQFVTPYFVGRNLALNTVVVFVALSFWAWLWSIIGMVIAVPLLLALRSCCEHIDGPHGLGDFLSGRHAEIRDEETREDAAAADFQSPPVS